MPLDIDEDHVLPRPTLGGPGLDLGEIDPQTRQRRQDPVQGTRLVAHGEEDRRLVAPGRAGRREADDEESGRVVLIVLDAGAQHRDTVEPPRQLGGDGRHRAVAGGNLYRQRRGGHLLTHHVGQVGAKPLAALGQPLRVGQHALDLCQIGSLREQVLGNVEGQFTADHDVRIGEPVERYVDGPSRGVLHGHDTVLGAAALDLVEHLGDSADRPILDRRPEALKGGLVREGGGRTKVGDRERGFEGAAPRQDLRPDGPYGIGAERARDSGRLVGGGSRPRAREHTTARPAVV